MKKTYLILMLCMGLFFPRSAYAQSCPLTGLSNTTSLFFFYAAGTSDCVDRPLVVTVGTNEFTLVECESTYSVYDLSNGTPLDNPSFFVSDFGYATCEYTNGNLTNETLSMDKVEAILNTLKVYPNPVTSGNTLNVKFANHLSVDMHLYDVTGKMILTNKMDNSAHKKLDLYQIPNGIYFLKIGIDNINITKKVVVLQ